MQYRDLHKGINTSDDAATSCENLVNFGAVTPGITFLICVPWCGYWAKIGRRSPFVALTTRVGRLKCRWAHLKQRRYVYISYKFSGLLSGTCADNASFCVLQASISTRVNSSTFTTGQHVCVSLLLARWRYCMLCRAGIRWTLDFAAHS